MNSIFMNNIFRCNNYIKTNNTTLSSIPYFLDFKENDKDFQALIKYGISNIIENILIFDRIYIDIYELPIILSNLYLNNKSALKKIINNGWISTIIMNDFTISTVKTQKGFTIAGCGRKQINIKNYKDLEEFVNSFSKKTYIDINYQKLYNNSLHLNINTIIKESVENINKKIINGEYIEFGIGSTGKYQITEKNKGLYDSICQFELDNYIAKILNIKNIWCDDFLYLIYSKKMYNKNNKEKFNKILDLKKIPNISLMLCTDLLTVNDIIKIKEKKCFKNFISWINNIDENNIEKEFISLLEKDSLYNKTPLKQIRILVTNGIGMLSPCAGITSSFIDMHFSDKLTNNDTKIIDKIKSKSRKKLDKENLYKVEFKKEITIDTSEEQALINNNIVYHQICDLSQKIDKEKNDENKFRYLCNSVELYNSATTYENYIALMGCMINYKSNNFFHISYILQNPKEKIIVLKNLKEKEKYQKVLYLYGLIIFNNISNDTIEIIANELLSLNDRTTINSILALIIKETIQYKNKEAKLKCKQIASIILYLNKPSSVINKNYNSLILEIEDDHLFITTEK